MTDAISGQALIGDQRQVIAGRPKRLTPEMKLSAATKTAAQLANEGLIPTDEITHHAEDIAKHGREHMDGYELAKALENRCYWSCHLQMAEALDSFNWNARQEINSAEKEWAKQTTPQPPLPLGTKIVIHGFDGDETGTIEAIYDHGPAKYLVKIDGDPRSKPPTNSRRIINFEDAVPQTTALGDRSEQTNPQAKP